ncbi:MAG: AsmA family protein [Saprospiraceae bacterium]|nr:AsmA family protein [Saprospiraceae bacterium]
MKKFLKKFAIIGGISLLVLIILATFLASVFQSKIEKTILTEVNKNLTSSLTVEDFDLTVVRSFPNISANLKGVIVEDSRGGVLLEAEQVAFKMGLFSLLGSTIKVKSVVVSDGALQVEVDKKGNANYLIYETGTEEEDETKGGKGPTIAVNKAQLEDMELIYSDQRAKQEVVAKVINANFSGKFSAEQFSLDSDATIVTRFLELEGARYLAGKHIDYDAKLFIDLANGVYKFEDVVMEIESNVFKVDGEIENQGESLFYDLFFTSEKSSLGTMIQLLPEEQLASFSDFSSTGKFVVEATMHGESSATKNPEIKAELRLQDGKITNPKMDGTLKDVSFLASFDNGKYHNNRSSTLKIDKFRGYFNRELLEFDLQVDNLDDPRINFAMDGVFPLKMAYGLLESSRISNGGGEIELKNIKINGRYNDMISTSRINRVDASGELEFDNAFLTINKEKMMIDNGRLIMQDNTLAIEDLNVEGAGSDIMFQGTAYNLIPVLFADSLNSKRSELAFAADLFSKEIDFDRLLSLTAVTEDQAEAADLAVEELKEERSQKREHITNFLNGTFNAKIEEYNFNKIEGKDFVGKLTFDNSQMSIEGNTNAMDGSFILDGNFYIEEEPRLVARLTCNKIDIKEFFRQGENFGQDVLSHKHLDGTLDSKIAIYAFWDNQGNFLADKLRVLAGVGIADGFLKDFEMLERFSSFVKVKDLRNIKFTNIENFLEVKNQRIYIPVMFIQSNALNLTISGEHSFEHEISYNIKVNAGQVISAKFTRHDPNLKPKKARKKGWFNLFYSILGTLEDFNVVSAKKRVKSDFEISELRKREIQEALEKEFRTIIELVDEPEDWRDIPEYGGSADEDPTEEELRVNLPAGAKLPPARAEEKEEEEEDHFDWEMEGGKKKEKEKKKKN